jgi:pimeloyl-ACP methyl ester carboxylesterase
MKPPIATAFRALRRAGAGGVAGAALALAAGWVGYSRIFVRHDLPLLPPLDAETRTLNGRAGRLAVYVAGAGAPLLLVHSVNAAASAYEMRPLFERLQPMRRVYAFDLPGFGGSERGARDYSVPLYVAAIHDLLELIGQEQPGAPVDAVALSLGAEFAARAALEAPARFRSLALISPTGFAGAKRADGAPGATREVPGVRALTGVPLWSQPLFDLLASRPSIRFFLERTWGSGAIDEGFARYAYLAAHQPGARHAPFAFLSGRLFSADIRAVYERLALPVWLAHGTRGAFADVRGADALRGRANWTIQPFETGALPHFEQPDDFARHLHAFLVGSG